MVGWPGGGSGVVDRGGRVVVEDEHGVSGHHSPERGWSRIRGGVDWRCGWVIGVGVALEGEIGQRPGGGGVLVAGDLVLPGS